MKGLVPYAHVQASRFPHSLEFAYVPLADLMPGPETFDWKPIEQRLNASTERGCQSILRVWMEYPGKSGGIPSFLVSDGVKITEWSDGKAKNLTPDYADERLITALERFVTAFGSRYDGDPRLGYLTAGLLGAWGEWHTWPREELFAPKPVQQRVMAAYESAFRRTRILLRYPAGPNHPTLADNARRPYGYHDDSFAWGTLATGSKADAWFFIPSLEAAGTLEKWRTQPIGGEIRPELWGTIFDGGTLPPRAQDFTECVRQTHVTWLMDSGLFREPPDTDRLARATAAVRRMGYDFFVSEVDLDGDQIAVTIQNQGIAPFYADWPMELAVVGEGGRIRRRRAVDWRLGGIMPGAEAKFRATLNDAVSGDAVALRVINPLPGGKGKALRFANATQDLHAVGWLTLGTR